MVNDYDRFFVTQQELAASKDVKPTNSAQGKRRTIIPHSSLVAAQLQRLALIFVGRNKHGSTFAVQKSTTTARHQLVKSTHDSHLSS